MKRDGIEKAGVAGLVWGIQGTRDAEVEAENLEKRVCRKLNGGDTKSHSAPGEKFLCLFADWYTNSIVGRGDSPASIRRRAPHLK
jgi:hypothetical protein